MSAFDNINFSRHGHRPTLRNSPISIELLKLLAAKLKDTNQASRV